MKLDVLSIGDCTVDVFLNLEEGNVKCNLKKQFCEICFHYGDKIPVEEVIQIPGTGNAANMAIGSSRLGLKSAICTVVGNEGSGETIIKNFRKEKVDISHLQEDPKSPTNYSAIINYEGERTIFSHHEIRKYKFPPIKNKPQWIYLTSVGQNYEQLYADTVKYCRQNCVKMGFNPGTLQVRDGYKKIKNVIDQCNVIIVNKEEANIILETSEPRPIKYLLKAMFDLGPDNVVITDGEYGAYSYNGREFIHIPATKTKVVERTGAGDAFSTGYIAAIIHGKDHAQALLWGTMNSDEVIRYVGPQKGLLTLRQMKQKVKKCPLKIKKI
ncbi:MAG: carbohydrate kinase family protein [Patescibacteria group bacterium]